MKRYNVLFSLRIKGKWYKGNTSSPLTKEETKLYLVMLFMKYNLSYKVKDNNFKIADKGEALVWGFTDPFSTIIVTKHE